MVLGGADGPGTEEGCVGNEEEKELRHLKLTCVEETLSDRSQPTALELQPIHLISPSTMAPHSSTLA